MIFNIYIDTIEMMCVVTDKIGPTMAVLREDVHQNIKVQKNIEP